MQETDSKNQEKALSRAEYQQEREQRLWAHLHNHKEKVEELSESFEGQDFIENYYRFYHHSFKAFRVQAWAVEVRDFIYSYHPDLKVGFNSDFREIVEAGTGANFEMDNNKTWHTSVLPLFTAAEHCRMVVSSMHSCLGRPVEDLTTGMLDYDWALVLYIYNMR